MDNHFLLTDDLLWDYADDFLPADEKQRVDAYLRQHPEWQKRLDALLAEKRALRELPLESPRPGFAESVMAAWAVEQVQVNTKVALRKKDWVVYAVTGVFGLFILGAVIALVVALLQSAAPVELPDTGFSLPSAESVGSTLNSQAVQYAVLLGLGLTFLVFMEKYFHQRRVLSQLGH